MAFVHKKKRIPVHGVLLLDKSVNVSSNDALVAIKRLLNAEKAGHTGTLDPFATGLLPLCFGEATKFAQDLLEADKTYEVTIYLGVTTTTGDTEGTQLETLPVEASLEQIEQVLAKFRGPLMQVPPMYSALKRDGKPLYEYARAGITLEREARAVTIHHLEMLDYQAPELRLRVTCSKGTYIRTLGEDIGNVLGCGAHLSALRRIAVGALTIGQAVTMEEFALLPDLSRVETLLPVDTLISNFPQILLGEQLAQRFLYGQRLSLAKEGLALPADQGRVRVYGPNGYLIGTGQMQEYGVLAPERLIRLHTSH